MDRKRGRGGPRGRGSGRGGAQLKQCGAQGEGATYGSTHYFGARGRGGGRDRGRGSRGRPRDSTTRMERPPLNYFTCGDIEDLSQADNQTVIRRITQNENGFLNAFKHDKFLKSLTVLKQLVNIVYKLSQSSDTQTALRVLAQLFSSSGEYSLFMFQLQLLISEIKLSMREGNLQSLFYLTEVGKFCFEKIPKTIQNTFPIKEIKVTV